jgi:hypothetical protein
VLARLSWPTLPAISLTDALRALALLTGALVLVVVGSNVYIVLSTRGEATSDI